MSELLSLLSSWLDLFLNILEFVALVASIFTFFFLMLNQFSKALKEILAPCGMTLVPRLRALFMCRKSPIKKRAFVEFAILKTQGYATLTSDWHSVINEFKAFYTEGNGDLIYNIPNCTLLIDEEFSTAVQRYFEFFGSPRSRKAFGIHAEQIGWVIHLHIDEAYITPTCLLTGLLSKYEENWSEFIKRFVSTAYITEGDEDAGGDILSNELYFTFAWLLWGPSYELNYQNFWAGLCQISYGDESNSVPAVAHRDTGIAGKLAQKLQENRGRRYGALVSADVSIFENRAYYKALRDSINPANEYFYNKIEEGPLSFAVQIDDFLPCESYKAKKYYCTAYVWILFELEDDDSCDFRPEKSVAFFEHANLTDKNTYQFLIETLIDKCIKHFEGIFSDPKYADRRYRFICAMNDRISDSFMERYNQRIGQEDSLAEAFRSRLLPEPKYTPDTAFTAFDEYFSPRSNITFSEVNPKDKDSLTDLGIFYTRIYMDCFPDPNERETFDSLLSYLKAAEGAKDYRYHILLAKNGQGDVVGGAIFDYFTATNSGVIEFIAIQKDQQSGGVGTAVYRQVQRVLRKDAYRNKKKILSNIFCEIDSPDYSQASIKKYLYFWTKHHFKRMDFSYIQPSLSPAQETVSGLWFTVASQNGTPTCVSGRYVLQVIHDYMKYAMRIQDPTNHPDYLKMEAELRDQKEISLLPIL